MSKLLKVIRFSVRILAIIMTFVILWGVLDVAWVIYQRLIEPPFMLLTISDILATFGAFIAVMIAIEIFENITVYLRDDVFLAMSIGYWLVIRKRKKPKPIKPD